MEETMKRLLLIALVYVACACSAWASGGLLGASQVANMQSAYGGWLIFMSGPNPNPDNCPINTVFLDPSSPQYKEHLAVLLSAQVSKIPINIYVAGCNAVGYKLLYFMVTG